MLSSVLYSSTPKNCQTFLKEYFLGNLEHYLEFHREIHAWNMLEILSCVYSNMSIKFSRYTPRSTNYLVKFANCAKKCKVFMLIRRSDSILHPRQTYTYCTKCTNQRRTSMSLLRLCFNYLLVLVHSKLNLTITSDTVLSEIQKNTCLCKHYSSSFSSQTTKNRIRINVKIRLLIHITSHPQKTGTEIF